MPTTRFSLAILLLSANIVLTGCNSTQPTRFSIGTDSTTFSENTGSDTGSAGQFWLQDLFPFEYPEAMPEEEASLHDPYIPEDIEGALIERTWPRPSELPDTHSTTSVNTLSDIDIWTRIRLGFQLTPLNNSRIRNQLEWYHAHPEHLPGIEEHARPYLHFIVEELERRGLPLELALLPAIESTFKPSATGPQGAAGIWQIMPDTGKMLGLRQTRWYDERRDVVSATEAALDYLESLATQFDGDWELALAAYNSGEGTVRRAIQKNRELGKATDFWSLDLPRGTKRYIPKLLALARVVEKPEAYGTSLNSIPNQPYFESVDIEADIDLIHAAKMADVSVDELEQLNPGLSPAAKLPQGSNRLLLPVENIEQFKENLAELDPGKHPGTGYVVQPGDSLGKIARRHGTTITAIKQANRLNGSFIHVGMQLQMPESVTVADRSNPASAGKSDQAKPAGGKTIYRVRSGDTLWSIAQKHQLDYKALAELNGLGVDATLKPGQQLYLQLDLAEVWPSSF